MPSEFSSSTSDKSGDAQVPAGRESVDRIQDELRRLADTVMWNAFHDAHTETKGEAGEIAEAARDIANLEVLGIEPRASDVTRITQSTKRRAGRPRPDPADQRRLCCPGRSGCLQQFVRCRRVPALEVVMHRRAPWAGSRVFRLSIPEQPILEGKCQFHRSCALTDAGIVRSQPISNRPATVSGSRRCCDWSVREVGDDGRSTGRSGRAGGRCCRRSSGAGG